MAKSKDRSEPAPPMRFELGHPSPGWEGEIYGVKFVNGRGATDSPAVAHALLEHGVAVLDLTTGKPAFGSEDPEAQRRMAGHAAGKYPR